MRILLCIVDRFLQFLAERLMNEVLDAVGREGPVLDLYCGSGLFSLPLAAAGRQVVGVEENRQAVRDAEANQRINRIPSDRVRFIASRVEEVVDSVGRGRWDTVVLDPPRQGCSARVLDGVFRHLAAPRVVYVSCNLETLVSELPGVLAAGYRVRRVQGVDMFPHTEHIETVVTLDRTG